MFTPIQDKRVYEQVVEQIKDSIRKGDLRNGDKLPPERELCTMLNVSRTSVREALRTLEIFGILESRQGGGNYIKDNVANSITEFFSIVFMLHGNNVDEILELRDVLEPGAAALAAKKVDETQLQEIRSLALSLNNIEDEESFWLTVKDIHFRIFKATGNYYIQNMMFIISSLIDQYVENIKDIFDNKTFKVKYQELHINLVEALTNRESVQASNAMKELFDFSASYLGNRKT